MDDAQQKLANGNSSSSANGSCELKIRSWREQNLLLREIPKTQETNFSCLELPSFELP